MGNHHNKSNLHHLHKDHKYRHLDHHHQHLQCENQCAQLTPVYSMPQFGTPEGKPQNPDIYFEMAVSVCFQHGSQILRLLIFYYSNHNECHPLLSSPPASLLSSDDSCTATFGLISQFQSQSARTVMSVFQHMEQSHHSQSLAPD
uniref:Uncharacterized protein n=1 Tax=Rhizophora mucronata TaxID=61149 RepID=A0A2P2MNE1_RHIMU